VVVVGGADADPRERRADTTFEVRLPGTGG